MRQILLLTIIFINVELVAQIRTIHVFVALCDNENQGIVPVPAALGNGQKPSTNLYWGATYGVKNYFTNKSDNWTVVKTEANVSQQILERIVFKHNTADVYLLADAYDGFFIQQTTVDFLNSCSGIFNTDVVIDSLVLRFGGKSNLLAYVGHDGLMEFDLEDQTFTPKNSIQRQAIMLACISKDYFEPYLEQTGAEPLLWTTGLMAPEAYTLAWAIDEWVARKTNDQIRLKAAEAYNHYQKCGINGAKGLLVTGW